MTNQQEQASLDALSARFEHFGARECRDASPLYERLSYGTAEDSTLLGLAAQARAGQPTANVFFAAVHYLLLGGSEDDLARFYPTVSGAPVPTQDPFPAFRTFCLAHRKEIESLISVGLVQTNEVRRSACLMPAFAEVARQGARRPLALIEIGASAGLNLLWDQYGYDYGDGHRSGDASSPVQLACVVRGDRPPPIPRTLPSVDYRVGLDLNPIDVRNPEQARWLRALIWPDEPDRMLLLERAMDVARKMPVRLIGGDAVEILPSVLPEATSDTTLCLFSTFTLNQFAPQSRQRLTSLLEVHSASHELFLVTIQGGFDGDAPQLRMTRYSDGRSAEQLLALCDPHGEWIEWRAFT